MRTGAVLAIAADHDARNAASRPTVPVPDRSCRTSIPVRGSDILRIGATTADEHRIGGGIGASQAARRIVAAFHAAPPWEPAGTCHGQGLAALSADPGKVPVPGPDGLRLRRWNDRAVVGVAVAAFASGFGQFGVVAALGDVARGFGQVNHGATLADQAGLSGTDLGIGLAIMRLASLGALPVTGLADRFGRRMLLLVTVGAGLAMTALAAASPGYWWFVAIFACGRPLLSATNGLAQVTAAEQTASRGRAKAVALIAAGYGAGAGAIAVVHSLAASTLGFRGVFVLALVPLALLPLLWRWIAEPDRFTVAAAGSGIGSRCSMPWPGRSGAVWR